MKRNMAEWKSSILNSSDRKAMPIMTYPGLQLTGNTVVEMVTNGEIQFLCMKALAERYPSIASATLIMNLSVEAEAFGSPIKYSKDEVPMVSGRLVKSLDDLNNLKIPKVGSGRTQEYLQAAKLSATHITDRPVFGGIIGPYSLASRLYDISEMMTAILLEPEYSHQLLEICTDFIMQYAERFKLSGTNGLVIAEPVAGLLSPDQCDEFSSYYIKQLVEKFQDDHFIIILHNCGNTSRLVSSMVSKGCMGFHVGNAVDMMDIIPQVPSDLLIFGNIDPAGILKNGSQEQIRNKTIELLNKTKLFKNFVLSSGCDIPPGTSIANIDTFFETLHSFNIMSIK